MPKEIRNPNKAKIGAFFGISAFGFPSDFGIRHSGLDGGRFLQQALFGLLQRTASESMLSGADQKVSRSGSLPYHLGNVHRSFPGRMIVTSPGLTPCQLSRSVSHRHFGIGGLVAGAVCPASVVPRFRVAEGDGNEV